MKLAEIASVIRSKNAGPFCLTIDVIFPNKEIYTKVIDTRIINKEYIGKIYGIKKENIEMIEHDESYSIKITIVRPQPAASFNDTDIYGAQQHVPMLDIIIPN